jgi:glycosidase
MVEKSLQEVNLKQLTNRSFTPSPAAWEDQVLYFLMVDRFSNGRERDYLDNDHQVVHNGEIPLFQPTDAENAVQSEDDAARWRDAGGRWVGGTLKGLLNKIGYLKRLGITAIWVSPIFRQVPYQETYHGYGIQNFLDVDPHFGTREDLKEMVKIAHEHGIYVIMDIIINHSGNVFSYHPDRYWTHDSQSDQWYLDPRWDGNSYTTAGFHDHAGQPDLPFRPVNLQQDPEAWPGSAIWPAEFQEPSVFTRKGRINNWDYEQEYLDGDFFDLKDIHLGTGPTDDYVPSPTLAALCDVYKFWIAYADIDGFRVDTVKHMDPGAARFFNSVIHEFTERIGKENFYLIGEITGGRSLAFSTLETTGMDAALGIDDIPDHLEYMVKGYRNPQEYFSLFRNSMLVHKDSHIWFRNKVVTLFDDHDQVRKGQHKGRFCAGDPTYKKMLINVLAVNLNTLGIPCIYYGTEQSFDGEGNNDRYIREAMFGGEFGAFRSRDRHFFDESGFVFIELGKIIALRKQKIALRRGRQYMRPISGNGIDYGIPKFLGGQMRTVVPWSRSFDDQELILAINTDPDHTSTAWVDLDPGAHPGGKTMTCLYSTAADQIGQQFTVQANGERRVIQLSVPPAGFVVYE